MTQQQTIEDSGFSRSSANNSRINDTLYLPLARSTEERRSQRCIRGCHGSGLVNYLEYNERTRKVERNLRECACRASDKDLGHRRHGMLGTAVTAKGKHGRRGRIPQPGMPKRVLVDLANKAVKAGAKAGQATLTPAGRDYLRNG